MSFIFRFGTIYNDLIITTKSCIYTSYDRIWILFLRNLTT
nr:MAG TPA: hypothetical protein [Caudoviricetes sp.]DAV60058.1 MAG TPA: hypothetical protein [Caudoviricetes sp.]